MKLPALLQSAMCIFAPLEFFRGKCWQQSGSSLPNECSIILASRIRKAVPLCFLLSLSAMAQTTVTTSGGTTNAVPVFTGSSTVGSSVITQANGNVGIGTTNPTGTLVVAGGTAAASTNGTNIQITAQSAGTGNQNGGNIVLTPGAASGTGTPGVINLGLSQLQFGYKTRFIQPVVSPLNSSGLWMVFSNTSGGNPTGAFSFRNETPTDLFTILTSGNVGVGTTSPGAKLEVDGGVKLTSGSTGGITFADGTTQTTAYTGSLPGVSDSNGNVGIGTTTPQTTLDVNGSLHVSNPSVISGLMLNNSYLFGAPSVANNYKIATLPASTTGTLDHLHLVVTVNPNWQSTSNSYIDAVFANRGSFAYQYTLRGAQISSSSTLKAFSNSDGSVDIYLSFGANAFSTSGYTVLENEGETVYVSPVDVGATPTGTLVFDSSSSSYPPATYVDYAGNFSVRGNLKLALGSGASITFQDGTTQNTAYTGVTCGGDYAESVNASGDRESYEPGDVLVLSDDTTTDIAKSVGPYSTSVAGIYSTKPGIVGRRQLTPKSDAEVPMAMVGIVPTKVSAENGPIHRGDLLVTSSMMGYAMKGTDRSRMLGAVVGKAMGSLESGTGVIEVLVTLQ